MSSMQTTRRAVIRSHVLANMETRNGVKAPTLTDNNRSLWDTFSDLRALGAEPTVTTARLIAERRNLDPTSAVVTFHMWNRYYS